MFSFVSSMRQILEKERTLNCLLSVSLSVLFDFPKSSRRRNKKKQQHQQKLIFFILVWQRNYEDKNLINLNYKIICFHFFLRSHFHPTSDFLLGLEKDPLVQKRNTKSSRMRMKTRVFVKLKMDDGEDVLGEEKTKRMKNYGSSHISNADIRFSVVSGCIFLCCWRTIK